MDIRLILIVIVLICCGCGTGVWTCNIDDKDAVARFTESYPDREITDITVERDTIYIIWKEH